MNRSFPIKRTGPIKRTDFIAAAAFVCLPWVFFIGCASTVKVPPPPETAVENVADEVHGVEIIDPYRWLEDQEAPKTRAWLDVQNAYTDSILEQIPDREALKEKVARLIKIDTLSAPTAKGGRYFFTRRKADQALNVIYMREGLKGKDQVLIDPHSMSEDHTVSVGIMDISEDGRLLAYTIRQGGKDEAEIRILDVDARKDLPDLFPPVLYLGLSFTLDNSGVYYTRFTQEGARTFYHELGSDRAKDKLIFGEGLTPDKLAFVSLSENGKWLIAHVMHGTSGPIELYLKEPAGEGPWTTVITDGRSRSLAQMAGDKLIIKTDLDAPNQRVMIADPDRPTVENWKELIPEDEEAVLQDVSTLGGKVATVYLKNVQNIGRIYDLDGKLGRKITFAAPCSFGFSGGSWTRSEAFLSYSSFHIPPTIFRYDMDTGKKSVWAKIDVPVDSEGMALEQVFYPSKDGTEIPMFILHKKGMELDGTAPTLITGYGGFDVSLTPAFSATAALWVECGGVFCVANLRGGGEFGKAWHRAGMLENKQNVFDDFIAAGEWLIKNGYTSKEHLGIMGGSNGGLLVGACMVQRPDLYGAGICIYPRLEMSRFQELLVAALWVAEYGSSENADQFEYLHAYSPYHHVREGVSYPATLFITGDGDTRVAPLHARKMTAVVQANNGGENPIMLRYYTKAGHAGGMPVDHQIDQTVEILSFLKWRLE